jgi:hypothetical protein
MNKALPLLALALLGLAAYFFIPHRQPAALQTQAPLKAPPLMKAEARRVSGAFQRPDIMPAPAFANRTPIALPVPSAPSPSPTPPLAPASIAAPSVPRKGGKPPISDPVARIALSMVGQDEDAELYWLQAINDPSLSAEERKDLIEDLNEDGLSDYKNPTEEDLPLILSRIALLEQIGPEAMDDVNAAAFEEAYKDLMNLYAKVSGQQP